jgi:hypothetical protein
MLFSVKPAVSYCVYLKNQSLNECRMNRRPHCLDYCIYLGERRGRDRMVVGFTTTCAISAYHH